MRSHLSRFVRRSAPLVGAILVVLMSAGACLVAQGGDGGDGALTQVATLELPHGAPGIGFDDLRFSPALGRVLVPAGRSGRLDLVDPESGAFDDVPGFSEQPTYSGGHDDGVTSADAAHGVIFATDRTTRRLAVIDPASRVIERSVPLAGHPDYVRFVEASALPPAGEVWVTEPDDDQIEIFTVGADGRHPAHDAVVPVPGGPESLVIDTKRSRAYTHLWRGMTVAIDLQSHAVVERWENGCESSRGIALDAEHGFLIAACAEGRANVLAVADGHRVSTLEVDAGVDVIDFDPRARHVYLPSAGTGTMTVAALSPDGHLAGLGRVATARGAHCVAVDRQGRAIVCDPAHGRLLVYRDTLRGTG